MNFYIADLSNLQPTSGLVPLSKGLLEWMRGLQILHIQIGSSSCSSCILNLHVNTLSHFIFIQLYYLKIHKMLEYVPAMALVWLRVLGLLSYSLPCTLVLSFRNDCNIYIGKYSYCCCSLYQMGVPFQIKVRYSCLP